MRKTTPLSIEQAAAAAPVLAHFGLLAQESARRMAVVRRHLPAALAAHVRPGVPEGSQWTLLVPHNAAAAKVRQLAPRLGAALRVAGHEVETVVVKVTRGER